MAKYVDYYKVQFFTKAYVEIRNLNSRSKNLCVDLLGNMFCPLDMHGEALR